MTAGACVRVAKTAIPAPPAILSIILGIFMCQSASAQAAAAWPRKIVAFGDSTTAPRGNLKVYADILRDELTGVQVINAGVGGNTTSMARLRFEADVLTHAPDLVLIQFGINDSAIDVSRGAAQPRVSRETYAANLRWFIAMLQARSARVILMTPNALCWTDRLRKVYGRPPYRPADPDGFNVILRDYAGIVRRVAAAADVPLVDVLAAYDQRLETPGNARTDLLLDGMHPNAAGQRLVADLLLKQIRKMSAAHDN